MEIFTWVLFILSLSAILGSLIILYPATDSDDMDDINIYTSLIPFVFIGFSFFLAKSLLALNTSVLLWKIENIIAIINLAICSLIKREQIEIHWRICVGFSIFFSAIPFIINVNFTDINTPLSILNEFSNNYPKIIFSFWLPILALILFSFILFGFTDKSKRKRQEGLLLYLLDKDGRSSNDSSYYDTNEKYRFREFDIKIRQNLYEEFQHIFEINFRKLEELTARQSNLIESVIIKINSNSNNSPKQSNTDDRNIAEIVRAIHDINSKLDIKNDESLHEKLGPYSNSQNQNFIRELNHFLITPLSQIESKIIIFNQNPSLFFENEGKFKTAVSTIKTSVDICKAVLSAYRELAFVTPSSESSPDFLRSKLQDAANFYKESMEKEVNFILNMPDKFPAYSTNYLLAVILPLVENAIKASPPNKNILIAFQTLDSMINIKIENETQNPLTINQLNTPGFSSKHDHTGTGLFIARHLVEGHYKGSIAFEIDKNVVIATISIPFKNSQ
ncbi:MAG: HAMP domain-containing histidine kinase [Bacteroidetes bacterium]|nr:HAMP domain-containing histidine kinase [Bacteroidota bacterium]